MDRVFRTLRHAGTDLDWGNQWTRPFAPILHAYQVQRILRPGGVLLFHVNALEDRPLRAKRKPQGQELESNYVLEADGQTRHFFSAAYLYDLLKAWDNVHLECIEIVERVTGEPFKRVWRGGATTFCSRFPKVCSSMAGNRLMDKQQRQGDASRWEQGRCRLTVEVTI